jgi:hypothetical protein
MRQSTDVFGRYLALVFVLSLFVRPLHAQSGPLTMVSSQDNRFEFFVPAAGGIKHFWQDASGHWSVSNSATYQPEPNFQKDVSDFEPTFTGYRNTTVSARDTRGRLMVAWISNKQIFYAAANGAGASLVAPGKVIDGSANIRSLAIATNQDGRIELFALTSFGKVISYPQESPGVWSWGPVRDLSNPTVTLKAFTATSYRDGRLVVVGVTKSDGRVMLTKQVGPNGTPLPNSTATTSWAAWEDLAGENIRDVVALQSIDHRLELVARGGNSVIYHRYELSADLWSPWGALSSEQVRGPILLLSNRDGRMEVVARRWPTAEVIHICQVAPNGGWATVWGPVVANTPSSTGPLAVAVSPNGTIGILDYRLVGAPALDSEIYFSTQVSSTPNVPTQWSEWQQAIVIH